MASELIKWFDAITATCCNVHPKIFEDINLDVAKRELGVEMPLIADRREAPKPDGPQLPLTKPHSLE